MNGELACFLSTARGELTLLGGAATLAAYGGSLCSSELECLEVMPDHAPGSEAHLRHGLCLAPSRALLPSDWKTRTRAIELGTPGLRVRVPAPEDLFVAACARYSDADRSDLAALAPRCDRLELIRRFRLARRLYRGDLRVLDNSFNAALREHYGLGPFLF